jgi:hypothetical protein
VILDGNLPNCNSEVGWRHLLWLTEGVWLC